MDQACSFLFWAYNVVWIAIAAYVAFLMVRLGRVRDRLDRLERRLAGSDPAAGPPRGA
jgi:CcmD family protein